MDEKLNEFWAWMHAQLVSAGAVDPGYFAAVSDVIDEFEERFGA
jgi:hypothetical protein